MSIIINETDQCVFDEYGECGLVYLYKTQDGGYKAKFHQWKQCVCEFELTPDVAARFDVEEWSSGAQNWCDGEGDLPDVEDYISKEEEA